MMRWLISGWLSPGMHPFRAGLGAVFGIGLVAVVSERLMAGVAPFIVAAAGASAVLVFAVPASPLARPWSVLGGSLVSALVGVFVARWTGEPMLAMPLAVGGAILAMILVRCLHPPGGAIALIAAMGSPEVVELGWGFVLAPVGLNACLLVASGLVFNNLAGSRWPHRAQLPPALPPEIVARAQVAREDIVAVLGAMEDRLDIEIDDAEAMVRALEARVGGFGRRARLR